MSAFALVFSLGPGHAPAAQGPGPCDPPNSNQIVCENNLIGNPDTEWDVSGAGDSSIQGFATDISVDQGQTVSFKIDVDAPTTSIRLDIYRVGYYAGLGARKVATVTATGQNQPACLTDSATGLVDCGNWSITTSWPVPATAVSGVYFAKAIRLDTLGASHIPFVVRDDNGNSDLLFQTSDTTWHAYNQYGGNSLYTGNPVGRAYKVSYNRPITVRGDVPEDSFFNAEYPMVRWLEANGYNVSYSTGVDTDRRGSELLEHKVFLSVGHDEYWSGAQRTNVEAARAAGVHLAFFSGNEVFWKTRWENSISAGGTPYRTLVTYKETHANAKIDPLPNVWTGTWRDPRFSPPADGGRPENALTGTIFYVNSGTTGIRVPSAEGKMRFWRNTSIANLGPGGFTDLPFGTLGYEWDEDRDNGFRPAGLVRMSDTTVSGVDYLQDYGSTYASGTANHALTFYKFGNALVFGAGTVQWSWGLDSNHDRGSTAPSTPMRQATVNLFADMGVQPLTLQSGLVVATPSTDSVAPTSTIVAPANGAGVPANTTIAISGTASDTGGGVVGGVEVSVDGGATWRRATGRENWSFTWQTGSPREVTIFSRAVDDSGNLATSGTGVSITVGAGSASCPCSIWNPTQGPQAPDQDASAVEVGTRFRSDSSGYITAIRYYKFSQNTGTHVGNLWSNTGTLLSTVTFSGESSSGWQEATLPSPVQISANTTYVVSYHTNTGFYAGDDGYFAAQGVQNGPLYAPRDAEFGSNGVYRYGASAFPNQTYGSENYWVDVVFVTSVGPDTTPPTVASVSPGSGASGVQVSSTISAIFSENVNASTVTSATFEVRDASSVQVAGAVSYNAGSRTATFTPSAPLAYSATYSAQLRGGSSGIKDLAGNALAIDFNWSFTTGAAPPPPPTEGPGGPILIVSHSGNPFSRYYTEILRAEGLNAFTAMDLSQVNATVLSSYDVVILGEMTLTASQVTMFSTWVNTGGNLIAMRPDKQLASLLGLTDASATLSEGYLLVNTSASPGAGIVGQTMQYHGVADRYALNGATSVATLYSNATTATVNPAVTLRSVGSNGGQAAAFAYDLAKSVVYTRQGNPAWSGQERDGISPIRSNDLFFGGAEPDYVNLNKVAIPQADEQQRLLANMIGHMNADRRLLPKFWYFPRGEKAVVIMTGDDHANNGTAGRFDIYKSNSPANCNVNNWECVRATSYIYPTTPITNTQVAGYIADGFEVAPHISTGCGDYTPASLQSSYQGDIASFASFFPSAPAPRTNRTHCIAFSDYDTQPQVALANGIRLDTNYYYWPGPWVEDRPGFMTGSGMVMRFAKADGTMIDVYQSATQLTDESDQSWPFTIDTLLDRAIGPEGYYGFFNANMHTDTVAHVGSEAIVASALARSVPVISAQQLLTWLDGRNGSSFSAITWNGTTLAFSIAVGSGANGLETMVPASSGSSVVVGITRGGSPVSYRIETIKGVSYAIFASTTGAYQVTYGTDSSAPTISGLSATPSNTSATIVWSTNEPADSRVDYGVAPGSLTSSVSSAVQSTGHTVVLPGLNPSTTYYYRARSADGAGNATTSPALASAPATFATTAAPSLNCPCTIWAPTATPAVASEQDPSAVELGVKFRASANGFISAIRFYKGPQNTGVHVANLWSSSGALLATAPFTNESATGWQQVTLSPPVAVTAGTVYVASYHTSSGFYAANGGYFQGTGVTNGPLEALANGVSGGNGVYRYGVSAFPTDTFNATNYWVDVEFVTAVAPDTTAPLVASTTPASGASGADPIAAITANFSEGMDSATLTTATFELRDGASVVVPATVSYAPASRTASLQPSAALAFSGTYTATVKGGATGAKDLAGNALASDFSWSFATASPPPPPPSEGPGGPILVVSWSGNPFTRYYAEILRAEGLNAFTVSDITAVTPATLAAYDVAILGEMPLSASQVTMLGNWVGAGGNLIAMRPDKQLADLLGLTDAGGTLANAYLQVNTATAPGVGIVGETIQFHGLADRYSVNGATSVAALFTNATTGSAQPAVTVRSVGSAGGQAAAFTFDLARSIVYTRQGNPAWSGQDRDGLAPVRSDDLFFGGTEADWVDLAKVAIPQADEQQRLLANLIGFVNADRKPLPKFWYLPNGHKAAVVMTGDDHGNNGTAGRFDIYNANSPTGCSVNDWECVRATSYIYPSTPITPAQASAYDAAGFEIGTHITTGCADYTPASIASTYASELGQFGSVFPALPAPRTNRTHCIVWSDYTSQADAALANGIRLDTNYYYWPGSWVNNVPGVFTGSGFPMRFARADGSLVDVYQAATQLTDESDQTYPFTVDALLDRALGPEGYFGTFVANMHTDTAVHAGSIAIVASAQARGVPVISARQLLTWLDGRNGSSFGDIAWDGNRLSFRVTAASGSNGLQGMLPASSASGPLTGVTRGGVPVAFTIDTVKGVSYAFFAATQGSYIAEYGIDTVTPVISAVAAAPALTSATVTWLTNESASSRVDFGLSAGSLLATATAAGATTGHAVTLSNLSVGTTYFYRVQSADSGGNFAVGPVLSFTTSALGSIVVTDTSAADFAAGSAGANVAIASSNGGELALMPALNELFAGATLPTGWSSVNWNAGATVAVSSGVLAVDGAMASVDQLQAPGRALEFVATFGGAAFQHAGFAVTFNENLWAIFSTGSGGTLFARTHNGSTAIDTPLPGNWLGTPHRFRIDWSAGSVVFSIDDAVVATHANSPATAMRPVFSDYNVADGGLAVDSVTLSPPYTSSGTFASRILDAGLSVTWNSANWTATVPAGTSVALSARFGNTPAPDGSWTAFSALPASGGALAQVSRFVQYQAVLNSGADDQTPILSDVSFVSGGIGLPSVAASDVVVNEGNSGTSNTNFLLILSAPSSQEVRVSYATANGTATAGSDYVTTSGVAIFAPGATSTTVAVPVIGDTALEADETFVLNLSGPVNASIGDGQAVGTIVNDELPTLAINDVSVSEGNSGTVNARFTVSLSSATSNTVSVAYATGGGTATTGTDYVATGGSLVFAAGVTQRFIDVPVIGDATWEANETFIVSLSAAANATIADNQGLGTITNDDPLPQLSIGDVSTTEGNSGSTAATFTVTLAGATANTVTVNYATANGTAVSGSDYTATSGSLSFPAGTTSSTFTVNVLGDTLVEGNETYFVNLSSAGNATIADGQAVGTIVDNDVASLVINNVTVTEGNSGTTNAVFTVTLSPASTQTVTVAYATANGTAVAPADYSTRSGTLTFAPGTTTQTVTVPVVGDTLDEANETFVVNLSGATNATIADNQGVGTITDNDATPSLVINNVTVTEGNSGTTNAVFTVTLSAASGQIVTVNYATANSSAVAPSDYSSQSGTLTFVAGTTTQSITVPVVGDTVVEANETFVVNLSSATNATIADTQGVGTITNDDVSSLVINNVTVTEGNSGTTNAVFTVTLSPASGQTVTVAYATANGTAVTPADYSSRSGTLTFAAGTTTQTVTVPVVGDTLDEANETFVVNLSSATNATIADNQGVGTITDNDAAPSLVINNVTVTEGNSGTTNAVFTVTLSPASGQTVTVAYATANGTAVTPADYSSRSGTLTFTAGTTTQTVTVPVVGDTLDEANETFVVNLSSATNATIADNQGVATITDNDATPSLVINNVSITEGNSGTSTATFTVTLSAASGRTVTVNFVTANGTATAGSDYVARTTTALTFAPGVTTQTIAVTVNGDTTVEANETFFVNLSGATNATIADSQGIGTIVNND